MQLGRRKHTEQLGLSYATHPERANGPLFEADNAYASVATIDGSGNEVLAGTLTEDGTPLLRTKTSVNGIDVTSYGDRTTSPTLEDFGTAQLRDGVAFVALEPTFASTIDARTYMVFVTPHGDSNSLYTVVQRHGFTVRESKGGRSTLAFDYRIVAKPLDAKVARLPAMAPLKRAELPKSLLNHRRSALRRSTAGASAGV